VLAGQAAAAVGVESCGRGKLLLRCRLLGGAGASAPTGRRGAGHIVAAARLQLIKLNCNYFMFTTYSN